MVYNRFSIKITLQIILLAIIIYLGLWSLSQDYLSFTKYGFFGFAILQLYYIIYSVNKQNREISKFLEYFVINEAAPRFKKSYQDKSFVEIEKLLNRIAESYGKVKLQSEEQHQLLQLLVDHLETAIIAYDLEEKIILFNKESFHLFGKELRKLIDLEMIKPDLPDAIRNIKIGNPEVIRIRRNEIPKPFSVKATRFLLNGREIKLISFNEIEKELAKEELTGLQTMIKILRHEIINSITPITTLADSISSKFAIKVDDDAQKAELLDISCRGFNAINKRGDGLLKFVEKIKVISAIPDPVIETIRVEECIRTITQLFEKEFEKKGISVSVLVQPPELLVMADEKLISQVLINLIKNATQALENTKNATIDIFAKTETSGSVSISVSDNGEGVDGENLDKIFIPFVTTRKNGSGIGLSFARQVMQMHKGFLSLEIIEGKTIFKMTF